MLGVVMRFCRLMTTDDLARWEPWGIPSTWRSPTTWGPGGSPRRDRQRPHVALPPGPHVVALGEVDGIPHPVHTRPSPRWWPVIPETCPPGEGMFAWAVLRLLM
jgi:hypothetical protein